MKQSFDYKLIDSDVLAPVIELTLNDPTGKKEIKSNALIDTGYDGEVLIPIKLYNELNLSAFEFSENQFVNATSVTGEKCLLRSASGSATIKGMDVLIDVIIDSNELMSEVLIGRKFLEPFDLILKGKEKKAILELVD